LNVDRESFTVQRREQEPLVYTSIAKLKEDYAADIVSRVLPVFL